MRSLSKYIGDLTLKCETQKVLFRLIGRYLMCIFVCICEMAQAFKVQSTHETKYSPNVQMSSCPAHFIKDAQGGLLCRLGTARYSRMQFACIISYCLDFKVERYQV